MPRKTSKKPLVTDRRKPKKVKLKVNGKTLTIKQKVKWDKGRDDTDMREGFLKLIREGFTNKDAAAACGAGTGYFRRRRKEDPEFEKAYQEAREDGNDVIRGEIRRRAVDGVKKGIYHDGKRIATEQVYSDQLLMFLAKSRMDEFKEHVQHDHTMKLDGAAEALAQKLGGILGVTPPELVRPNPQLIEGTAVDVTDEPE